MPMLHFFLILKLKKQVIEALVMSNPPSTDSKVGILVG